MAKRLALYFTTKKKDHQTPLSSVLRRTGWIIPLIKLSINLLKRDFHHLTCQSITHRKELSGEILFPLLPKNCTRFSNINGTGFYTIAFAYYIIRNSRGLDTFYYKENYCYECDELLFDGNTPEEFIASRPEARLLPSGVRAESEGSSPGNKVTTKSPAIGKCGEWCWQTKLSKKNITSCMDICVSKQEGNPVLRFFVGGVIPKMAASGSTLFQLFQEKKQAKTMKDSESSSKEKSGYSEAALTHLAEVLLNKST